MKKSYTLMSIAGDDMGIRKTMSSKAAKKDNAYKRSINSMYEWIEVQS